MELPVDPSLWTGVQAGITSGGASVGAAGLSLVAKGALIASAVVLVASLSFLALRETSEEGNTQEEKTMSESLEIPSQKEEPALEMVEEATDENEEIRPAKNPVEKQTQQEQPQVTQNEVANTALTTSEMKGADEQSAANGEVDDPTLTPTLHPEPIVEYSQDIDSNMDSDEHNAPMPREERLSAEFSATGDVDDHYLFSFSPKNLQAKSYLWEMGDGTSYYGAEVQHEYLEEGDYVVRLTTTNEEGESSSEELLLEVFEPSELFIPNVFTPNNDGMNARFDIAKASKNIEIITLRIFNDKQELVFQNDERGNIWDGTDQFGNPCKAGTYRYWLKAQGNDGVSYKRGGTVTLLR